MSQDFSLPKDFSLPTASPRDLPLRSLTLAAGSSLRRARHLLPGLLCAAVAAIWLMALPAILARPMTLNSGSHGCQLEGYRDPVTGRPTARQAMAARSGRFDACLAATAAATR